MKRRYRVDMLTSFTEQIRAIPERGRENAGQLELFKDDAPGVALLNGSPGRREKQEWPGLRSRRPATANGDGNGNGNGARRRQRRRR